ncbi:MAG TPA: hypothetical protein VGG51_09310 [Candidatus Cybelea sp.]
MKTFSFVMSAAAISTAAILSACSSGTSPAVSGSQVSPSTARGVHHVTLRPNHGRSWMDPAAKAGSLLYITDSGSNTVLVYSYPALKLVGTLTGFTNPQGDCVDKARNVWIVNTEASQLLEYAHGGTTPIATLDDPNQYPVGCAFDSTTGELAVSNFYSTNGPPGSISIYKNASGSPTLYTPPNFAVVYYLGFDPKGTLYLDGIDSGSSFLFDSFNGTTFKSIVLGHPIGGPGAVQSVGKDIVVGDQTNSANVAYTFRIRGAKGRLVKTTPLTGAFDVVQFYIFKNALVGGDINPSGSTADRFKYPAGGPPKKTAPGLEQPIGAVISK